MFGNTMNFIIDSAINAMAVSRDGAHIAVAGRSLLKVYSLAADDFGAEQFNLRSANLKNLNFANSDVTWCPLNEALLATAATNGAVVVWNLQHAAKSKLEAVFNDHKRTVNKVCFHNSDQNLLLSGSQDGCIKLFDLRRKEAASTFVSNSESVRDVQFAPSAFSTFHFASVQETGNVEIWDIRRTEKPESNFIAHDGPVFACEWHPNQEQCKWLATGGRDKTIKVWDLTGVKPTLAYNVHTINSVSKLKWRPNKDFHIGNCSLAIDFSVYVWDIKRPYLPYAIFGTRKDNTTGFAWKNDPCEFISTCKDGTVYQHRFETDAFYPAENYPPIALDLNPDGDLVYAYTDFIHKYSQYLNNSSATISNGTVVNPATGEYQCSRLVKTNSLGTNSMITSAGILSGSGAVAAPHHTTSGHSYHSQTTPVPQSTTHFTQPYSLSSSLNQNNWEMAPISSSATDSMKSRLMSMGTQYLPSQFQYHQSAANHNAHHLSHTTNPTQTIFPSNQQYPVYNISVPLSYKKSPESILSEHFRCTVSYMMMFKGRDSQDYSHGLNQNHIARNHFVESARSYVLSDRAFDELCELNASVAESLDRHQIAQTWRIVRHMFSISGRHPTSSGGAGNNPSGGSLPNMPLTTELPTVDFKIKPENPSRHTSGGTRHFSGNQPPTGQGPASTLVNASTQPFVIKDSDDDEERRLDIDGGLQAYHDPLKGISQGIMPSNKFEVDFFNLLQPSLPNEEEMYRNQDGSRRDDFYNDFETNQDWELQRESIMHRHNIADCAILLNDLNASNAEDSGANYDGVSSPVSIEEDEDLGPTGSELGMFDTNVQSLLHAKNPSPPSFPFTNIVTTMLRHYVDIGDVQTTVSVILVLGDKMRQLSIDKETINVWYRSYIDLLHRYRLFNVSTRLMQLSADLDIQAINQTSTSVSVFCVKCHKVIKPGKVCENCSMEPMNCAICHVSVRGLYTWCQGCAHGGHFKHMLEWFKTNLSCPAGCGHYCELC